MGLLARAVERHKGPCLLVLDGVDHLPRRTVRSVDLLLKRAPGNLHVVLAGRVNPGLDLTTHVLDGVALVVGPEALRFSTADIDRFFEGALSPTELAALAERTAGWPVALSVCRNARPAGAGPSGPDESGLLGSDAAQLIENYVGVRLLHGLSEQDRACLLDLSVFDGIDPELVDDVLGSSDARLRVTSLASLEGLLPSVGGGGARRLHPLLRDYCLAALAVEDPARKRSLHTRIARELARRGRLTPSWRHARAAGHAGLLAELIERLGVFEVWLREGVSGLISAGRFLTPEITAEHPRLDLLRCVLLRLSSESDAAAARFEAISERTGGFARDRDGGDADALALDRVFTQGALMGGAHDLSPDDLAAWLPAVAPDAAADEPGRTLVAGRHTLLCIASYERASFEDSRRHGLQAQAHFTGEARFGHAFVDLVLGMGAMAQGRAQEAAARYRTARKAARKHLGSDPCLMLGSDVLAIELDLERNHERAFRPRSLSNLVRLREGWVDVYSAATAVSAEVMHGRYEGRAAVRLLSKAVEDAQAAGIDCLSNTLSALQVLYLIEAGRSREAARVWRDRGLPCGVAELLDLERQSWRAMEALSCARVLLLVEQGDRAAAAELAAGLCAAAEEHGLIRTLLRGLALSMVVAFRARRPARAQAHLAEFLRANRGVGYVRPLVRQHAVSQAVLRRMLGTDLDDELRAAATSASAQLAGPAGARGPIFSTREIEVLEWVTRGMRNKEIAGRLGISDEGVRFHLKRIYRKAGVSRREDAVRYAQSLGVLSS